MSKIPAAYVSQTTSTSIFDTNEDQITTIIACLLPWNDKYIIQQIMLCGRHKKLNVILNNSDVVNANEQTGSLHIMVVP